jgi:DNA-binding response OmpR family regulator
VIGGDSSLFEALTAIGRQYGFTTRHAPEGGDGIQIAEKDDMDVIVLDLDTPDMTGFDVCRRLRHAGVEVPVLMLSDSADPIDIVVGLEIGADDFIVKPFELRELAARVQAKLRRQRSSHSQVRPGKLRFPGLTVDIGRHEVLRDGRPVTLTPTEFDLLALLSACPGKVISRSDMIEKVWGREADLDLRSVDAHVYRLRRKIEPEGNRPTYIHAVPGVGYRFERRGLTDRLARAGADDEPDQPSLNGAVEQRVAAR